MRFQRWGIPWSVDQRKDANDQFVITKNGDGFLIASQGNKVGTIYKDGVLQVKGVLLSADLTYVKKTDTIITPA